MPKPEPVYSFDIILGKPYASQSAKAIAQQYAFSRRSLIMWIGLLVFLSIMNSTDPSYDGAGLIGFIGGALLIVVAVVGTTAVVVYLSMRRALQQLGGQTDHRTVSFYADHLESKSNDIDTSLRYNQLDRVTVTKNGVLMRIAMTQMLFIPGELPAEFPAFLRTSIKAQKMPLKAS